MATKRADDLFPEVGCPPNTRIINEHCLYRRQDGNCVVIVAGIVLAQFAHNDPMAQAYAMVQLVEQGWANQNDVARAFGCCARTLRRHQRRFEEGGLAALGQHNGYPHGRPRVNHTGTALILQFKAAGYSNREIARRVGVSEMAIRKRLRRMGWNQAVPVQQTMALIPTPTANPNLSAFRVADAASDSVASLDRDPADRRSDRLLARLGLLEDAAPLFGSARAVTRAGVLLALPGLVHSGVFDCAQRIYGSLGPAFFGLRTSLLTLLLMALWRIKRPESLKEHCPQTLGQVLGLDRAPEVKTLRRKLSRLAACGKATEFGRALAQQRIAARGQALGFLYVDGHVRVYHGQHHLPKTHVARMRLSMPATSDDWVNDTEGEPLFVVTAPANAGLVQMLPGRWQELRALLGQRRVTFVFDRGGYSPKLFAQLLDAGFDLLTYRKGRYRPVPRRLFRRRRQRLEGQSLTYVLADQEVRLGRPQVRLRQVTRLMDNGHQTAILTSRRDLPAVVVAYRMFERWRQENFFKYLREEYALDALAEHAVEPDDPSREVPNPAWHQLEAKLRQAYTRLDRLQAEYGLEAMTNDQTQRPTMRGFKIAQAKLGTQIQQAMEQVATLAARRAKVPRRLPVGAVTEEPIVKLAPARKHLTNLIKMVAYQAESDLLRLLAPHYKRAHHEGRTLIQSALAKTADLCVTKRELRVTLAPLSSAHRTRSIAAVCEQLNEQAIRFPGSNLRLRYAIQPPP